MIKYEDGHCIQVKTSIRQVNIILKIPKIFFLLNFSPSCIYVLYCRDESGCKCCCTNECSGFSTLNQTKCLCDCLSTVTFALFKTF